MSKNIKLNDTNYNGVSTVQLPTTDGGIATFKDTDEITTPSGAKTITENGTHDVTNFAQAIVNVASSGGSSMDSGVFTPEENTLEVTLETTEQRSKLLLWKDDASVVSDAGVRHLGCLFVSMKDESTRLNAGIGTNSGGTAWTGTMGTSTQLTSGTRATFNENSIDVLLVNGNGDGYLLAGQTYNWIAW